MSGYDSDRHHRRSIRLAGHDYGQTGAYFITICTHERWAWFGIIEAGEMNLNAYGKIATEAWQTIPQHFANTELDEFVVMPNHMHGIVIIQAAVSTQVLAPNSESIPHARSGSLPVIIQAYKAAVTRQIRLVDGNSAMTTTIWQSGYHDRIIRGDKELEAIRQYIHDNPLRWELDTENPSRQ